jgi:glucose/arabinose dehydrogenase
MMKIFFCTLSISLWWLPAMAAKLPLEQLKLPPGFKISVFAEVPNARSLAQAPDGRIFVGTRAGSEVYVIENGQVSIFADGLDTPNGVAIRDGKLYVAEVSRILEFDISKKGKQKPLRSLPQTFPKDTHHGWKFIRFGPDGMLYVPVGANCNVCDMGANYGRIYRVDVNGTSKAVVAKVCRLV